MSIDAGRRGLKGVTENIRSFVTFLCGWTFYQVGLKLSLLMENEIPHVNGGGGHTERRRLEKLSTQFSACELSKVTTGHNPKSNGQQNKFGAERGVGGLGVGTAEK